MNRRLKFFVFIIGVAAGAVTAVVLLSRGRDTGSVRIGPEETLEAFCRAMAAGKFQAAEEFCDTLTMKEHLMKYRQTWDELEQKDSGVLAIASGMLESSEIIMEQTVKNGDTREIHYTIKFGEDNISKVASMRKEEGEWKIERITDRN